MAVSYLIHRVLPFARELGDQDALGGIARILERGNGADRIRPELAECGDPAEVVRWISGESALGVGLDRRSAQRERCA